MFKEIMIGAVNVPMLSVASANVLYRRVFKVDPITLQADKDMSVGDNLNFGMQMGYIMNQLYMCRENREALKTLSEDTYLEWLDQFDNADMMNALVEIISLYNGQAVSTSDAKKKEE